MVLPALPDRLIEGTTYRLKLTLPATPWTSFMKVRRKAHMGWGLACADETEFTFVMADSKGEALQLITLAPAGGSK